MRLHDDADIEHECSRSGDQEGAAKAYLPGKLGSDGERKNK